MTRILALIFAVVFAAHANAMDFEFERHDDRYLGFGVWTFVYASGPIESGTARQLTAFLDQNQIGAGEVVVNLNSDGGSVSEAMDMGRIIRQRSLWTNVSVKGELLKPIKTGRCLSACVLAFLGGVRRGIISPNVLGVHRFFIRTAADMRPDQAIDQAQITSARIVGYLHEMDIDPLLFTEMSQAGTNEINILSERQLTELKVLTPSYHTEWEVVFNKENVKGAALDVYVRGTTKDMRGEHKLIFLCDLDRGQPRLLLLPMFQEGPQPSYMQFPIASYDLVLSTGHLRIAETEIIERDSRDQNGHLSAVIRITPRLLNALRNSTEAGFAFNHLNGATFEGWTGDLTSGREKIEDYVRTWGHDKSSA